MQDRRNPAEEIIYGGLAVGVLQLNVDLAQARLVIPSGSRLLRYT